MAPKFRWNLSTAEAQVKAILGLGALLIYAVVRVAINAFYDRLGLTAEMVGIGQAEILGRAALYAGFFAVVALPIALALSLAFLKVLPGLGTSQDRQWSWAIPLSLLFVFPGALVLLDSLSSLLRRRANVSSSVSFSWQLGLFAIAWLYLVVVAGRLAWLKIEPKPRFVDGRDVGDRQFRNRWALVVTSLVSLPAFVLIVEWNIELRGPLRTPVIQLLAALGHPERRWIYGFISLIWLALVVLVTRLASQASQPKLNADATISLIANPGTIAALGLMALTALLLAQMHGEYLAAQVERGRPVKASRFGMVTVRADRVCLSWPDKATGELAAQDSKRPYRQLTGPYMLLGQSSDRIFVHDFLDRSITERSTSFRAAGQLLQIPKGSVIIARVQPIVYRGDEPRPPDLIDFSDLIDFRDAIGRDIDRLGEGYFTGVLRGAQTMLIEKCSSLNSSMFPSS